MNRWIVLLSFFALLACNSKKADKGKTDIGKVESSYETVVTVSVLPQKYFIEQIAGDLVRVNVLIPPGASPATYEPTASQLVELNNSVIYMKIGYVAFELSWMDKIRSVNKEMAIIDLSEGVDLIREHAHHGDHHGGIDPHIWLSPVTSKIIAGNIYRALSDYIPSEKRILKENYETFLGKLDSLDNFIRHELKDVESRGFMSYHPALSYFARDYNFKQYPLELEGKSPSSTHMKYLADIGKQEDIGIIFLQMQFDQHNAEVLASEIGAEIVQINPLDQEWYDQMVYITGKLKSGIHE